MWAKFANTEPFQFMEGNRNGDATCIFKKCTEIELNIIGFNIALNS